MATTTTEDPASFPKTGELELVVEGVCHSGHMLHWSSRHGALVMADIWGQQYVRCGHCDVPLTAMLFISIVPGSERRIR